MADFPHRSSLASPPPLPQVAAKPVRGRPSTCRLRLCTALLSKAAWTLGDCAAPEQGLPGAGGIALGHLIELSRGGDDLVDADRLLLGSGDDLFDRFIDLAGALQNNAGRSHDAAGKAHALFALGDGLGDHFGGFSGGVGRTLGQSTHFLGRDGKTGADLTRAVGFERGVERGDVGPCRSFPA